VLPKCNTVWGPRTPLGWGQPPAPRPHREGEGIGVDGVEGKGEGSGVEEGLCRGWERGRGMPAPENKQHVVRKLKNWQRKKMAAKN
jgi:hypothetical protein